MKCTTIERECFFFFYPSFKVIKKKIKTCTESQNCTEQLLKTTNHALCNTISVASIDSDCIFLFF